ncbi:hypothetical protein AgCh_006134 [Apium graveolens]
MTTCGEDASGTDKVPSVIFPVDIDNMSELKTFLYSLHVTFRSKTIECVSLIANNKKLTERNDFLEAELLCMHENEKTCKKAQHNEIQINIKYARLEKVLEEKERNINNAINNTNHVKFVRTDKNGVKSVYGVGSTSKNSDEKKSEPRVFDKRKEEPKIQKKKSKNIGLLSKSQLNKKNCELTARTPKSRTKRGGNGKQGINKASNYKYIPDAPRKACFNCGNTNHIAIDCRVPKKKVTKIPKSDISGRSVLYKRVKWHFGHSTDRKLAVGSSNSKNFQSHHFTLKTFHPEYEEKVGPMVSYGDDNVGKILRYGNIIIGNVIISKVVKVADFGVARVQSQSKVMTVETGSYRYDSRGENFAMMYGTSMAALHVIGLTALIRKKYPRFSLSAIASALSTTASLSDRNDGPLITKRTYANPDMSESPAIPFGKGSGFVNATATLNLGLIFDLGGVTTNFSSSAPKIMYYSTRGPDPEDNFLHDTDILKPNLVAPRNFTWAAWSSGGTDSVGFLVILNGAITFVRENFAMMSGTSMAAPHVTSLATLIKKKHPSFSPSAITLALSTTAYLSDRNDGPLITQRTYANPDMSESPATPFGRGSGFLLLRKLQNKSAADALFGGIFSQNLRTSIQEALPVLEQKLSEAAERDVVQ